jgi:hypothetical protein
VLQRVLRGVSDRDVLFSRFGEHGPSLALLPSSQASQPVGELALAGWGSQRTSHPFLYIEGLHILETLLVVTNELVIAQIQAHQVTSETLAGQAGQHAPQAEPAYQHRGARRRAGLAAGSG